MLEALNVVHELRFHLIIRFQPCGGWSQNKLDEDGQVLLDPNTWIHDGTISLALTRFSVDAKYLAFGQSASGSDWVNIKVMDVEVKVVLQDTLLWVRLYYWLCE